MDAKLGGQRRQAALERADNAGGDAGGVPVHPHHRAEGLKPERMREPAQQLVAAVMMDDRLAHDRAEPRHAGGQPLRHPPAMKRKIGAAAASCHGTLAPGIGVAAHPIPARFERKRNSNPGRQSACVTGNRQWTPSGPKVWPEPFRFRPQRYARKGRATDGFSKSLVKMPDAKSCSFSCSAGLIPACGRAKMSKRFI